MLTNRQLFLQHVAQTSPEPILLEIERASGTSLFDHSGREYTDLISGISVSNLGHNHPVVVQAVKAQVDRYMHLMVYGEYVQSPQVQLAEALCSILPDPLRQVYFVNSGTEAIEGAMKLSKRFTGRTEMISFRNAYHGSTQGALSLMGDEYFKQAFRPLLPDVRLLSFNQHDELKFITKRTACVVVEMIQGEAGAIPASVEFMQALRHRCRETGTLLVADEIQTGFGRTGTFFAFEHYQVVPDILVLAKGMGGGMPLGAFVSSTEIMKTLSANPVLGHITTFGGHPVCCAAGLATLRTLQTLNLGRSLELETRIRKKLQHPLIREISGRGLLLGVAFENHETALAVIKTCISRGIITDWFLFAPHKMRLAPPLVVTDECLERSLDIILEVMNEFH